MKTPDLCREHRISVATFYGWKQKLGGLDANVAQRLSVSARCSVRSVLAPALGSRLPAPS